MKHLCFLGCGPYVKLLPRVFLYGSCNKNIHFRASQVRISERAIILSMHPLSLSNCGVFIHFPCTDQGKNCYVWLKLDCIVSAT